MAACLCGRSDDRSGTQCACEETTESRQAARDKAVRAVQWAITMLNHALKDAIAVGVTVDLSLETELPLEGTPHAVQVHAEFFDRK